MKTYRTLTSEARIMLALIVPSIGLLCWGIYINAQRLDAVGALVLTIGTVSASVFGAFIVTCEVRDNHARIMRNRLNKYHNAQIETLSDAIYKAERANAVQAHNSQDTLAKLTNRYDTLNDLYNESVITHARDKSRLVSLTEQNRVTVARFAHARELLAETGLDLVEHDEADAYANELRDLRDEWNCETGSLVNLLRVVLDPTQDGHGIAMTDLLRFTADGVDLGMRDETLVWYAQAIWNGEGKADDDLNRLALIRENYGLTEEDYPVEVDEPAYTMSASTALLIGSLDKAYQMTNGETRYPLTW